MSAAEKLAEDPIDLLRLGRYMRRRRMECGFTLLELALKAGVSRSVSDCERGLRTTPWALLQVCRVLGVDPAETGLLPEDALHAVEEGDDHWPWETKKRCRRRKAAGGGLLREVNSRPKTPLSPWKRIGKGSGKQAAVTMRPNRMTQAEADEVNSELEHFARPETRGDCAGGERPCPWVSCRYHLYLDVTRSGTVKFNFPNKEPWELADTCALDVAGRGGSTLEDVGHLMQLTRERIRQVEAEGLMHFAERLEAPC